MIQNRFDGQCAVVTGGGSGIGEAIARRLASEGAHVTIWDISPAALDRVTQQAGISGRQIDVTDPKAVSAAMQADADAMGGLDIVVCSAGITGPNLTTWDYPVEDWHRVMDLNLNGVFYCNRAAAPILKDRGYGRIINIASIAGKEGNPNAPAYSTSKAAVIGLTKSLGKELAGTRVTVNAVAPAVVETAILDQMTPEFIAYMKSKIPMGRFGTTDEIASMVCWMASKEASFTTGAVFDQSGGRATY
ncbi:SDR family NAD(P)-dependent oxidoreductase [Mesobacterium sp. TK19101]|uniref:SDR family NAD(P)-dependent oxidoreductase n=1 Tax=Mesobacterium hydrothermale TaxID=3111907 RepID=A0ABU6HK78_9RHOB|nr:SDR family NAD(P)-dependent oxidoreductase [Mesobacterium sp. TK19101]MEC3862859.1 SDR family NAD(P)-dependent oxidoreductase [Mesobacterium sp. TK19101]